MRLSSLATPNDAADGLYMSGLLACKSPFLMNAVVEALNISPDDEVLELGIGLGDGVLRSYRRIREGKGTIYSVDRWNSLFESVRGRFPKSALEDKRIVFNEVSDAKLLPFNNEFFDKIFHVHSAYFWAPDLPATLAEIIRVLKPGGVFLCGMHLQKLQLLEKGKLIRRRQFDPSRYLFELEPAGFADVRMEYTKGRTNKEYQLIFAKKPLEMRELRDPNEVAAFLEEKLMKEYVIERSIDDGHSLVDIQHEFLHDKTYDDTNLLEGSNSDCMTNSKHYSYLMVGNIKALRAVEGILITLKRLKHFITTPIFYANGSPHIGHLYTALLADASNRWKLLRSGVTDSDDFLFTTGTDEHGLKIQQTAAKTNQDPQSYCNNISNKFKDLFCSFGVQPSDFIRTTETRHKEVVKRVWAELDERGQIQRGKHEGWYSTTDECFYSIDEVEKLNGQPSMVSKITGSVVEWVQEENYVFPLFEYLDTVRQWLTNCDVIRPKTYFPEALQQANIKGNLSLSRDRKRVSWGITVPNDGSQTIYVWFDALINYLTVSGIFSDKKTSSWPPTCQIVGKDILRFHAVIWPAFLLALDLPLPKRIFVHGHWLVNGAKMSKSVGNVVDPFIAAKVLSEEGLRYFLLRQGTPQSDANFNMAEAINVINADLVNNVANLLQRSVVKKLNPSQTYPIFYPDSFRNGLLELGEPLVKSINELAGLYEEQFDELMIYKALELLMDVARQANGFFQSCEPWKELDDRKVSSLLYICYEVLRICGILLQPVVPHYADRLLNRLGMKKNERGLDNVKIMSNDDRPKKRAKKASHECTVILVDVGANMNKEGVSTTDMELTKDVVEWIVTRKIFTESIDEFTLVLFGSEVTRNPVTADENIFFCEEEMQQAKIDWLRLIDKEIKASKSINGDFLAALIVALDYMRNHLGNYEEKNITARNILLITNLGGFDGNMDDECIEAIVNGLQALEINFNVIGPSIERLIEIKGKVISNEDSALKPKELFDAMGSFKMESAECMIARILKQVDGVAYSFDEALPMLQRFVPRKVNLRGQKFYLELGIDLKVPLQMYKKIHTMDFKLDAEKYALTTGVKLKRKTVYEKYVKNEEVGESITTVDVDTNHSDNLSQRFGSKTFEGEIVKGYKFGTTIVPYNDEDQKEYGWKQENRCLKLIQFSKRSQILEHYLMDGGAYYFIPLATDKNACIAISALVNAMIVEDSVALTRYVYNASSQPRIMGLFPRRSKKGIDMFVGIQLPFYEDFRGLDFPQLDGLTAESKSDHLNAMHAFVKEMDLTKAHYDVETGQFEESLRPRDVPNPKLQNVCKTMKYRVLHPNAPLPTFEDKLLGDLLEPNSLLLKRANESLNYLKIHLPLLESPNKKQYAKGMKEEILPRMSADGSVSPESGKLISAESFLRNSTDMVSLVGRLDLQPKEISYLKLSEESKLLPCGAKGHVNSPSKQSLQLKLRLEACRRMWKHKLESLPTNEDIELFRTTLRNYATYSRSEDGKVMDYYGYKQVMSIAPKALQDFLSTKIFMELLQISNAKDRGIVTVDSIIDYLLTKKDKLSKLIQLHYYDSASKGYFSVEDLQNFLEEEVLPHIPSLANLNEEEPMLQDYYLCMATRKFFFLLDPMQQKRIRIVDIVASGLLEELETLNKSLNGSANNDGNESAEIEQMEDVPISKLNWFSKRNLLRIKELYEQLDADGNGLLSFSEMIGFQHVTNSFMQRVFEVQQTYDNDEIDLRGFCDLLLAMENKSASLSFERSALNYYFRVLDVDGDNLLSASDLNFFYRDLARMLEKCLEESESLKAPSFEDIKNEIFDMCNSKSPEGITLKELISSGKGATVVGMLTDLDAFFEYENREDITYDE
ncbi:unnamed protein product [Litomosoides sigmodontis]|uniref:Methionine--tRNA ligase, mitochondrial n=1 Tax=Litomosoides sigmodontis TaxID=42156 RepID=A0A3P6U9R2_LITSI|nr:unnamed protein product [Litomosoides sigmodontis]